MPERPMPEPHLRAADADRAAVAEVLGRNLSAGRLTVEEYDERLTRAWEAKTYGDLTPLTADLPDEPAGTELVAPAAGPAGTGGPATAHTGGGLPWGGNWGAQAWAGGSSLRAAWGSWGATALIVLTVWAMSSWGSGQLLYFWPVWVIGPWGIVLAVQTLGAGRGQGSGDAHRLPHGHRD
ncbi:uncharacterized protein DUF1707 [Modestobacter roseus]|uniref:Uncharacterized protein DUF1707 n=2 Tax=Modestobacter roseus TaxID=1181884 RepID=A0A562IVL6_9ACTN|nr:DUF1707 domain-containing protein [Modestobacter roseus]TWH74998.1 uncharacterized protein DUF1707 [Modestobacter roseus]